MPSYNSAAAASHEHAGTVDSTSVRPPCLSVSVVKKRLEPFERPAIRG